MHMWKYFVLHKIKFRAACNFFSRSVSYRFLLHEPTVQPWLDGYSMLHHFPCGLATTSVSPFLET